MTIDLFAASFICRDAELDAVFDPMSAGATIRFGWWDAWASLRTALTGLIRRSFVA